MPVQTLEPLVQRVRYPFAARHVQLLARETLSPGFVRLTLGGPDLAGFASPGFDDHVKLALPQEGRDKPNLPVLVDGIPIVEGPRPTLRDYTPLHHDGARHTVQLEFAVYGDGPAAHWARTAPLGQWVGLAGPRGSMLIPLALDWHLLLGDESAMPAIACSSLTRPTHAPGAAARRWTACSPIHWPGRCSSWPCPPARDSSGVGASMR